MFFNSIQYFIFLPVVFLIYYSSPDRFRWSILLAASIYFYAALDVSYLLPALFWVTVISYTVGILLGKSRNNNYKKILLSCGLAAIFAVLVVLKYLPFLKKNIDILFTLISSDVNAPIPESLVSIGVSFYAFQAVSYLVDIYRDDEKPEKHFGYFALYLIFFAKVLQGPIERAGNLLPQIRSRHFLNFDSIRKGLILIAGGLFKKMVIADRLAQYVDPIYNDVHSYSGAVLIAASYLYALQIYFDFSGYTDIAIGTGRLFNINLSQNFKSPYLAASIGDFWRRWHITLSTWFRDYVYIPLEGNRVGKSRRALNLLIVFLLCGVWHGANWTFIVWGLVHGLYLAAAVLYKPIQQKLYSRFDLRKNPLVRIWRQFLTFNLVCFAWIFFRADSLSDAGYVVTHLFSGTSGLNSYFLLKGMKELTVAILALLIMALVRIIAKDQGGAELLSNQSIWSRWAIYYAMVLSVLFFGYYNNSEFIYFNF